MNSPSHIQPGEPIPLHPACDQLLEVTEGVVYVMLEDEDVVLTPGDTLMIPRGSRGRAWNAGDDSARVVSSAFPVALAA